MAICAAADVMWTCIHASISAIQRPHTAVATAATLHIKLAMLANSQLHSSAATGSTCHMWMLRRHPDQTRQF